MELAFQMSSDASSTATEKPHKYHKNCEFCGVLFGCAQTNARLCSKKCMYQAWRIKNKEKWSSYMASWKEANPEAFQSYNEKRRKPEWRKGVCPFCSEPYEKNSKRQVYCGTLCRGRARAQKPGEKEAQARYRSNASDASRQRLKRYMKTYARVRSRKVRTVYPWLELIHAAKSRATKSSLDFDLTREWAESRWTGKCELTQIPFTPPEQRTGYKLRNFFPSIDKIDPKLGYIKSNCRFVLWGVNSLKRDGTDEDMYVIALALIQNRPS